ncbi:MAG: undecaprenyl-diphosphate phosphatase [Candidatus Cloacimonetes bacterium]|jgi:undecaprenyl-diphosphatase|nr:undecaprenyl-diphosphate phosphatase [Candidatus Cloacimonadota bacterium]
MTWWEAIILGVVQGLTEFFPVSSSGHLVMSQHLLGLSVPGIGFEVAVHVATLISVLIVYRDKVYRLLRGAVGLEEKSAWPYLLKLLLASVPAAVIGLGFQDWFEARFDDPVFTGTMLLVTGMLVWSSRWTRAERLPSWTEFVPHVLAAIVALVLGSIGGFLVVSAVLLVIFLVSRVTARHEWKDEPTWGGALLMGIAQACAILPGISRSGSTVVTGLWRRIDPVAAAEFSFLMSIPAILGAAVLALPDLAAGGTQVAALPLAIGFLAAGIAGVLAIRWFVALLAKQNFHVFAYYCWIAGTLFLLTV